MRLDTGEFKTGPSGQTVEQRFHEKVEFIPFSTCHWWIGSTGCAGYGELNISGKAQRAHRIAFEMANGPIPEGKIICHKCDNPSCVNPSHLFVGTYRDNLKDMYSKGRENNRRSRGGKLDHDDVKEIRNLKGKLSQRAIGAMFNVSHAHVGDIHSGKRWGFLA